MGNLSPLQHRINVILANLRVKLFPSNNLIKEVHVCCNQKLPKDVKVIWKRENDGFIVGHVNVDGYEFTTQGKNAKDFINMVNDAIYAIYEIPPQYIPYLGGYQRYFPKPDQLELLKDKSITNSTLGFYQNQHCPAS